MPDLGIDQEAEAIVRALADRATAPRPRECLACFVARMLEEFGCDCTLRFARHYRDVRAPRASGLERRLGSMGGFCDCEIFLNGLQRADLSREEDPAPPPPPCRGAQRGSTQACGLWMRHGW
ncbi:hypothetical protein ACVW00_002575 [Marmoricola sp. URHA0025 HA25]